MISWVLNGGACPILMEASLTFDRYFFPVSSFNDFLFISSMADAYLESSTSGVWSFMLMFPNPGKVGRDQA